MLIELESVQKIYRVGADRIDALAGVSLSVEPNEYVAVMGPSGSGKSTLMNVLGCLDRPSRGTYRLAGQLIRRMSAAQLARVRNEQIGFVFQSFELMPRLSAVRNVSLPLTYSRVGWRGRRRLAIEAIERVGLRDRARHRPSQLSGGEKQRVAIARALVNRPSILLADEPTGNLDSRTGEEILDLIDDLHRSGQTVLVVTHDPNVAQRARRIIRMLDGRIHSDLPREEDASRFAPGQIASGGDHA